MRVLHPLFHLSAVLCCLRRIWKNKNKSILSYTVILYFNNPYCSIDFLNNINDE